MSQARGLITQTWVQTSLYRVTDEDYNGDEGAQDKCQQRIRQKWQPLISGIVRNLTDNRYHSPPACQQRRVEEPGERATFVQVLRNRHRGPPRSFSCEILARNTPYTVLQQQPAKHQCSRFSRSSIVSRFANKKRRHYIT